MITISNGNNKYQISKLFIDESLHPAINSNNELILDCTNKQLGLMFSEYIKTLNITYQDIIFLDKINIDISNHFDKFINEKFINGNNFKILEDFINNELLIIHTDIFLNRLISFESKNNQKQIRYLYKLFTDSENLYFATSYKTKLKIFDHLVILLLKNNICNWKIINDLQILFWNLPNKDLYNYLELYYKYIIGNKYVQNYLGLASIDKYAFDNPGFDYLSFKDKFKPKDRCLWHIKNVETGFNASNNGVARTARIKFTLKNPIK